MWDSKLKWEANISNIKAKSPKGINLLKVINNKNWGADTKILLKIYKTNVRSVLDYGCQIYGSAKPIVPSKINPIHNTALRLATGAHRTSPVASLSTYVGENPLHLRRQYLATKYVTKVLRTSENPNYQNLIMPLYSGQFLRNKNIPKPLAIYIKHKQPLLFEPKKNLHSLNIQ